MKKQIRHQILYKTFSFETRSSPVFIFAQTFMVLILGFTFVIYIKHIRVSVPHVRSHCILIKTSFRAILTPKLWFFATN